VNVTFMSASGWAFDVAVTDAGDLSLIRLSDLLPADNLGSLDLYAL
jgi:hypothetical protein